MKKFALFLFSWFLCSALFPFNVYAENVEINKKNFPDAEFRTYVKNNFDKNNNNVLEDNEAESVTVIPVNFTYSITSDDYGKISITQSNSSLPEEISDFTGIEYFVNLETFSCQNNELDEEPDLSKNPELKALFCNNTKIQDLDLSKNGKLLYLDCSNNKLKDLDLSADKKLLYLDCSNNKIKDLELYEPGFTTVTQTKLSGDVSVDVKVRVKEPPNPLMYLKCDHNAIKTLDLVDLDENLLWLKCDNNKISGKFSANDGENLLWLECDNNKIKLLELDNRKLCYLKCDNNQITELDAVNCKQLEQLICDNNKIKEFSLPRNANKFVYLSCSSNDIDIMDNVPQSLEYIDCSKNKIDDSYFLKKGVSLKNINCSSNKLGEIDLSNLTLLEVFICDNNCFPDISFANNSLIKTFSGSSQKIYGQKVADNKGNKDYPYEFDLVDIFSRKAVVSRVIDLYAFRTDNSSIKSKIEDSTILMAEKPAFIQYKYNLGGQLENNYLDVTLFFSEAPKDDNYGANDENNEDNNNDDERSSLGSSGGGCNSGFISGIFALSLLGVLKKKK